MILLVLFRPKDAMASNLRFCFALFLFLIFAGCTSLTYTLQARAQEHPPSPAGNMHQQLQTQSDNTNSWRYVDDGTHRKEQQPDDKTGGTTGITTKEAPLSALEKIYAGRTTDTPRQFGYDLFSEVSPHDVTLTPMGAVQDDYVLGTGDELLITFTGQRTDQTLYKIDPRGNILIKDMPPLPATGKTIAQLRSVLNARIASMHNTQSYVSLSAIRQIGVLVVGHVKKPGRKTLSAFNNVLDALNHAGGITKDGSLRQIKLVRSGHSSTIDLFTLLLDGAPGIDMTLKDGDRLIIPSIGASVAISGAVKRPGIYEISATDHPPQPDKNGSQQQLSLTEMLNLGGGVLSPGKNRFIQQTLNEDGQENIREIKDFTARTFKNGSILSVMSGQAKREGTIELAGETSRPGLYDLARNKKLSDLLNNSNILGDDIYPLMGIIERWDNEQLSTRFLNYPVRSVLKNEFDLSLENNDVVRLLSNQYISTLFDTYTSDTKSHNNDEEIAKLSNDIFNDDKALKIYLKEHSLYVRGAVRRPGHYPVAQGVTLDNILAVAGGVTLEANLNSIEITSANFGTSGQAQTRSGTQRMIVSLNDTSPKDYLLSAGDSVRINQKIRKLEEKSARIFGEVLHPGEYDLLPGDNVLSLIQRAGGLTQQAYPAGAIFSRESERRTEELRFRKAAHDMQRSLAAAIKDDKNRPDATQIELVRSLASELEDIEAVGRITIQADPAVLTVKPEQNMLLEHGDRLFIPKRPLSVRVSGEVLSPSALQFIEKKSPRDYIQEAGGFTFHADKTRTFVLYPNGSAEPLQVNTWNHNPVFIPPGSTIIIPRDPKPFDFIESAREVGQILSNLAITAVFIDDIRD